MPWWFVSLEKGKRVPQYSSGGDNTSVMSPIKHMTPGPPPPHWKLRWYVYICSLWHKLHFERYAGMYTYVVDSAMKLMRWAMIILVWSIGGCWNTYGDICMRWKWLITKTKLKQEMYPHKQNTVPLKPKIACTHTSHFKKWFGDRKSKIILSKTKQELKKTDHTLTNLDISFVRSGWNLRKEAQAMASWTIPSCHMNAAKTARRHSAAAGESASLTPRFLSRIWKQNWPGQSCICVDKYFIWQITFIACQKEFWNVILNLFCCMAVILGTWTSRMTFQVSETNVTNSLDSQSH